MSVGSIRDSEIQFCASDPKFIPTHSRAIVIVSTLDGHLTAFDGSEGSVLWSLESDRGPLLSSTISNYKFPNDGRIVQLIPALDGDLYTFDGKQMGTTPISADNLLSSSMKMNDDTVITGGKEIRIYGISRKTGHLQYSCGMGPCQYFGSAVSDDDILVLRQTTRTVRAVSLVSGTERWNYSVAQHEINLISSDLNGGCHGSKNNFFTDNQDMSEDNQMHARDEKYLQTDIWFKAAEGHISVWNRLNNHIHTWEHNFDSPIVHAWKVVNEELQTLDIFENRYHSNVDCDEEESEAKRMVYIGSFNDQLFILQSQNLLKSVALEWKTFGNDLHSAPPQVTWQPYLNTASSRTPILRNGPVPETAVIIPVRREERSSAVAIVHNEGEYPFDSGLYLLVGHPLNTSGLKEDTDEEEESTFDQIIIVSLWYWWKEVLVISVTFAIAVNVCFTRHYIRNFTSKFVRDSMKETSTVELPQPPCTSNPLPPSKGLESQTSSDSSFLATPPSEFVSRYLTDFEHIQNLGKGGFGVVFQSRNKFDDCEYAIKRIRMPNKEEAKKRIMREVKALAKLDHSGIVRYYNSWLECPPLEWQQKMDSVMDSMSMLTPSTNTTMDGLHNSFIEKQQNNIPHLQTIISETGDSHHCNEDMQNNVLPTGKFSRKETQEVAEKEKTYSSAPDNQDAHSQNEPYSLSSVTRNSSVCRSGMGDSLAMIQSQTHWSQSAFSKFDSDHLFPTSKDLSSSLHAKASSTSSGSSFIRFEVDAQSDSEKPVLINDHNSPQASSEDRETSLKVKAKELALPFRWTVERLPRSYLYIQMQLCHKDSLKDWLCAHTEPRDRFEVLGYFYEIISAVEYVHEQCLMHRDLKPSNILFALDGSIKIGDFGLVTDWTSCDDGVVDESNIGTNASHRHTNQVGTLMYMSPEQLTGETYDHKVDVYASGLILFELLVPFSTAMERYKVMTNARELKFPPNFVEEFPLESALVKEMLSPNARDRPSAAAVKQHSLLQDYHPRPEYLRHRRSRSMSLVYSTSSSSTNSYSDSADNGTKDT